MYTGCTHLPDDWLQNVNIIDIITIIITLKLVYKFNVHKPRAQPYKGNPINHLNAIVPLYKILVPGSRSTNIFTVRNTWLRALGNDGADCDSRKLISVKKVQIFLMLQKMTNYHLKTAGEWNPKKAV